MTLLGKLVSDDAQNPEKNEESAEEALFPEVSKENRERLVMKFEDSAEAAAPGKPESEAPASTREEKTQLLGDLKELLKQQEPEKVPEVVPAPEAPAAQPAQQTQDPVTEPKAVEAEQPAEDNTKENTEENAPAEKPASGQQAAGAAKSGSSKSRNRKKKKNNQRQNAVAGEIADKSEEKNAEQNSQPEQPKPTRNSRSSIDDETLLAELYALMGDTPKAQSGHAPAQQRQQADSELRAAPQQEPVPIYRSVEPAVRPNWENEEAPESEAQPEELPEELEENYGAPGWVKGLFLLIISTLLTGMTLYAVAADLLGKIS